jgi:hypothetical protein
MASPSPSPTTRWALRLSLLAGGVAVALTLQPHLLPARGVFSQPATTTTSPGESVVVQTYCYQAVRTAAAISPSSQPGEGDCFEVLAGGVFGRVFSSGGGDDDDDDSLRLTSGSGVEAPGGGGGDEQPEIRKGYVLPGLWDGHGHLLQYGEFLHSADLFGADSPEEVRRRLRVYLAANPGVGGKGEWARGIGWDQMVMGGMPFAVSLSVLFICTS